MLLYETNIFPIWQCFTFIHVQWGGTSDQEQILHCSKTHSPPNNVKKAAAGCLFPYLWLTMDNFQSLTCQFLTEQSATVLSLDLQVVISSKSFFQKHLYHSSRAAHQLAFALWWYDRAFGRSGIPGWSVIGDTEEREWILACFILVPAKPHATDRVSASGRPSLPEWVFPQRRESRTNS